MNQADHKGFLGHSHHPHHHGFMFHLEHWYYDERFWTVAALVTLLAVLILMTILASPMQTPISEVLYWRNVPGYDGYPMLP